MRKLNFGDAALELPSIGLGLAALGRPGYINLGHGEDLRYDYDIKSMEQRTHEMLDLAFENGVRYFDTANSYGKAESFLMSWLEKPTTAAAAVIVGSKWGYTYTADWKVDAEKHEVKEHSLEVLDRQWSFARQLLPQLKLYLVHSATFESGILKNAKVLNRLAQLKEKGLLIGLSTSGPQQAQVLEASMNIQIDGNRLFDVVQSTYNLLERAPEFQLKIAAKEGMIVVVKEALANGRLTQRNTSPSYIKKGSPIKAIAEAYRVGIDAVALAFILSKPWVSIVLSGAVRREHLLSNLQARTISITEVQQEALKALRYESSLYWKERSALKWN